MPLSFFRITVFLRRLRPRLRLTATAAALGVLQLSHPAFADQVDSHEAVVQGLIQQQHASPLVADCAAHAAFVVPTNPAYDHVEFLPSALDDQHATIENWGKPFDNRKQRISVDTVVSVSGLGYRKNANESNQPDLLNFRCGYMADKLLAFGWNEPAGATPSVASIGRGGRNHHGVRRGKGNGRSGTAAHATKKSTARHVGKSGNAAKSKARHP